MEAPLPLPICPRFTVPHVNDVTMTQNGLQDVSFSGLAKHILTLAVDRDLMS